MSALDLEKVLQCLPLGERLSYSQAREIVRRATKAPDVALADSVLEGLTFWHLVDRPRAADGSLRGDVVRNPTPKILPTPIELRGTHKVGMFDENGQLHEVNANQAEAERQRINAVHRQRRLEAIRADLALDQIKEPNTAAPEESGGQQKRRKLFHR